jgi:hypothetical protein
VRSPERRSWLAAFGGPEQSAAAPPLPQVKTARMAEAEEVEELLQEGGGGGSRGAGPGGARPPPAPAPCRLPLVPRAAHQGVLARPLPVPHPSQASCTGRRARRG